MAVGAGCVVRSGVDGGGNADEKIFEGGTHFFREPRRGWKKLCFSGVVRTKKFP